MTSLTDHLKSLGIKIQIAYFDYDSNKLYVEDVKKISKKKYLSHKGLENLEKDTIYTLLEGALYIIGERKGKEFFLRYEANTKFWHLNSAFCNGYEINLHKDLSKQGKGLDLKIPRNIGFPIMDEAL